MEKIRFKRAIFSLNYEDISEPRFEAYYILDGSNFPQPLFEKKQADRIVKYFNTSAKKYPKANWDFFKWDGEDLLWFDGQMPKEEPILIKPQIISIDGKELKVYSIGETSWLWEHEDIKEKAKHNAEKITVSENNILRLAKEFSNVLRNWLSAEEIDEVIRRNKLPEYQPHGCASHDFCDANMAMYEAFTNTFHREHNMHDNSELELWGKAWDKAIEKEFFIL